MRHDMNQYSLWLIGFACGLLAAAILHAMFAGSGMAVAAAFGLLLIVVMLAKRFFERGAADFFDPLRQRPDN